MEYATWHQLIKALAATKLRKHKNRLSKTKKNKQSKMIAKLLVIFLYFFLALASYRGWGFAAGSKRPYRKVSKIPKITTIIAAFLVFSMPSIAFTSDVIYYTYFWFCFVYMLACMLSLDGNKLTSIACLLMSFYCLVFGIDSWVNHDAETWVYNNHEYIVIVLHSLIVLSFSSRFSAIVVSFTNYCLGYSANDSDSNFSAFGLQRRDNQTEVAQ